MKMILMRHGLSLVLICMGILSLLGCQAKVDNKDLIGIYRVTYPYGMEQLKIMPDGTYEQLFALKDQQLKTINKGKWEITYMDGQELVLNDPVIVDDGFGNLSAMKKKEGIWPLHVHKSITGKVYFPINEDQGFTFKRVS